MLLKHVAREIAANALMGVPAVRRRRVRLGRTEAPAYAQHIRDQFDFFMDTLKDVRGKDVAEIGPGDALGLGALFLRSGAASYTAYNRFQGDVFSARAMALYRELDCPAPMTARIRGAIEDAADDEHADVIVSFNVMEHLRDPHAALRRMAAILKPGGVLVHRIDYGAHDIWRAYEDDRFLQFPEWLWSLMGSNRGYPNRVRHGDVMATIRSLGLDFDERVTGRLRGGDAAAAEIACGAKLGRPFHAAA